MIDFKKVSCPHCGKKDFKIYSTDSTCMYYPPRYVNGVNVNPDKNVQFTTCKCCACGKEFYVKSRHIEQKIFKTRDEAEPTWSF